MADSDLLSLPTAGALGATDAFYVVQGGVSKQVPFSAMPQVLTTAILAALDLSTLPTSNPGGGKLWLNGSVLTVGSP